MHDIYREPAHGRPSALFEWPGRTPRPLIIGVGGPVGSGKTALVDIYTREDAEFLCRSGALEVERIVGVETGGCPHSAIREDASINLEAAAGLADRYGDLQLILVESGGDNLAATFSPELADYTIYVIDVAAGDKIPRKGGPGITRSDLLLINKVDLAPHVGADLQVMDRDTRKMRGNRPFIFSNLLAGQGLDKVVDWVRTRVTAAPQNGGEQPVAST